MSIFDNIGSGLKSLGNVAVEGIKSSLNPGSLIQAGASLVGGLMRNRSSADQANAANEFSANQFATRYQTTVKDMEAAGLNPMLAYSQGASGQPSGQQAVMQDYISPAVSAYQNSNQDILNQAQAEQASASAAQSRKQIEQINATVDKTRQEIENLKTDNDKAEAMISNLNAEYQRIVQDTHNLQAAEKQIKATIVKLEAEVPYIKQQSFKSSLESELIKFDIKAAKDLGNVGRDVQQVKPLLDIIRGFIRR